MEGINSAKLGLENRAVLNDPLRVGLQSMQLLNFVTDSFVLLSFSGPFGSEISYV